MDDTKALTANELKALLELLLAGVRSQKMMFAVGVSGGADSLALTFLMHEIYPNCVTGLTVDHGLRPEAKAEADQVNRWLSERNIRHEILRWEGDKPHSNIQSAARQARYDLMRQWCQKQGVAFLVTAHHREDVAETLLMRLGRGSGLKGLAAMPSKRSLGGSVTLLRPLLSVPRLWLKNSLIERAQGWIEDPSNQDMRYDRVRARAWLAYLMGIGWDVERVCQSAHYLRSADEALTWAVNQHVNHYALMNERFVSIAETDKFLEAPDEIVRRALLACIGHVVDSVVNPRGEEVDQLLSRMRNKQGGTLAGCWVRWNRSEISFSPEPPRRSLKEGGTKKQ